MATTNHERVGKALELLKRGLGPFVAREFTSVYGDRATACRARGASCSSATACHPATL